jgi:glyoxylase-like metal-dependent hydrolase (beta-lactamase superfamily II)
MYIRPFHESDSGTWTYLLADPISRQAAIIDPVWVYDPVSGKVDHGFIHRVLDHAAAESLELKWVLETHAHADHLSAAAYLRERTGARIAIGRGICEVQANFARVFNLEGFPADGRQFDRLLQEGDEIELGQLTLQVMETPGHTRDSLTYRVGNAAFIGDTLFSPSFGTARCDFPGGDAGMLYDSIARLHALPPETRLHLCHDYPGEGETPVHVVTVAESRAQNIHTRDGVDRDEFVAMRTSRESNLKLPRLIYPSLQVNIRAGKAPAPESNGARYLRIPFDVDLETLLKQTS